MGRSATISDSRISRRSGRKSAPTLSQSGGRRRGVPSRDEMPEGEDHSVIKPPRRDHTWGLEQLKLKNYPVRPRIAEPWLRWSVSGLPKNPNMSCRRLFRARPRTCNDLNKANAAGLLFPVTIRLLRECAEALSSLFRLATDCGIWRSVPLSLLPWGFRNADLRPAVAALIDRDLATYSADAMTYGLRCLSAPRYRPPNPTHPWAPHGPTGCRGPALRDSRPPTLQIIGNHNSGRRFGKGKGRATMPQPAGHQS
jgi:hypothetical protein